VTAKKPAAKKPAAKKMGRPAYKPTDKEREQVKMLSAMGVPDYDIAKVLSVSEPTLRKYYAQELETGHIQANAQVAQSLFRQATDKAKPNVVAGIFWMKTRGGWKEAQSTEPGKKDERLAAAKKAGRGKFSSSPPPLALVKR
jgi:hypothetical protein